jgi:glycosyltransferase involved in cell wall biosynthesis
MRVMHVTEVTKGGTISVLNDNALYQISMLGADNVLCLMPQENASELVGIPDQCVAYYDRDGRNIRSLLSLLISYIRLILSFKPDVVHIHSTFAGVVCRTALVALSPFIRPKVVYCPHGWAFCKVPGYVKFLYRFFERILAVACNGIICVSQTEYNEAVKLGIRRNKLALIYNGVDLSIFGSVKKAPSSRDKTVNALFVGRFSEQKGLDLLLDAMDKIKGQPVQLTIIGSAAKDNHAPKVSENIIYKGWQSKRELVEYYAAADVVVVPSRWEAFGLVAIEAGAAGTAVLAANVDGLPEIVVSGQNGYLVPPEDSDALADYLGRITKAEWTKLGKVGKGIVNEKFTMQTSLEQTLAYYKSL